MFGMGGGASGADNEQGTPVEGDGSVGPMPPPPAPSESNTNEWGDPWLSDEQAGVSNPDDSNASGFFDTLSDFFGDDE
jgi:hypothetical protein